MRAFWSCPAGPIPARLLSKMIMSFSSISTFPPIRSFSMALLRRIVSSVSWVRVGLSQVRSRVNMVGLSGFG